MKLWLYGKPFSGKTTFVSKIPNSLILSTDGNAKGLFKDEQIIPIKSVQDLNNFINDYNSGKYKCETLVVDVLEHVYDLLREYTLEKNKIEHETDMGFGKGYALVKDAELYTITKLLRLCDNVILVSHEDEYTETSILGKETTKYRPAINYKLHDKLSGYMTMIARTYVTETTLNGKIVRKYYISIGDTANELSGTRVELKETKIENNYDKFIENMKK